MNTFWERYPALLFGFCIFLAMQCALQPGPLPFFLLLPLLISLPRRRVLLACSVATLAFLFARETTLLPSPNQTVKGTAFIEIIDVKEELRHGKPYTRLKVAIDRFVDKDEVVIARNMRAALTWKGKSPRPEAGFLYEVKGALTVAEEGWASLHASNTPWKKVSTRFSLVEQRIQLKKKFAALFDTHLPNGSPKTFLEGLFLGEFHDPLLAENLRRFGLSHIMVVSGFHFSLVVAFLAFFLRFTLPWRPSVIGLVLGATLYLFFIGPTPSVMRSWISVFLLFIGKFFEKRASGLNSLGVALIVLLFYEPAWSQNIGFQLSFLATFAILLFYAPVDAFLSKFLKERSVEEALQFSSLDQWLYMAMIFIRKSVSLSLAVGSLTVPLSLFYFQEFQLLGLFYNLFFPIFTALLLFLLCFSLLFSWVPVISTALFWLTHSATSLLLVPVQALPHSFDITWRLDSMPSALLVVILALTTVGGIRVHQRTRDNSLFSYI